MSAPLINNFIGLFIYREIYCHYTITGCCRLTDYILFFWLSPAPVPLYLLLVVLNLYRTVSDTLLVDNPSYTISFILPK